MTAKIKKELSLLAVIIKNNVVFFVALTAALLTMFIIPPDEKYIKRLPACFARWQS